MIKPTASVKGIQPETVVAISIAHYTYYRHWQGDRFAITSATDDAKGRLKHSLHKQGYAVDLRLPEEHWIQTIATELAARLGHEYDVVLEKDHIHVEYQP